EGAVEGGEEILRLQHGQPLLIVRRQVIGCLVAMQIQQVVFLLRRHLQIKSIIVNCLKNLVDIGSSQLAGGFQRHFHRQHRLAKTLQQSLRYTLEILLEIHVEVHTVHPGAAVDGAKTLHKSLVNVYGNVSERSSKALPTTSMRQPVSTSGNSPVRSRYSQSRLRASNSAGMSSACARSATKSRRRLRRPPHSRGSGGSTPSGQVSGALSTAAATMSRMASARFSTRRTSTSGTRFNALISIGRRRAISRHSASLRIRPRGTSCWRAPSSRQAQRSRSAATCAPRKRKPADNFR